MNKKVPLKKFAELLASEAECKPAEAQTFVKDVFQIIAEKVYNGESVEIHGLGVFSASPNLTEPVKFEPAVEFADELNSPFAMFQPIVIGDGISVEEINAIQSNVPQTEEVEAVEITEPTANETDLSETVAVTDCEVSEVSDVKSTDDADDGKCECDPDSNNESKSMVDDGNSEQKDEEPDIKDIDEMPQDIEIKSDGSCEPDIENETKDDLDVEEAASWTDREGDTEESSSETCTYLPEDDEEYVEYYDAPKSRFGIGFIIGLLSGLIIGALAFAAYAIYFANNGQKLF